MKLPVFLKQGWKGLPLLSIVTILNAATFWPIAYDSIDFISHLLGFESRYASFEAMPVIFYVAWGIFTLVIGSIALKLTLSIVSIMASKSYHGNGDFSAPNTVTADFNEVNEKQYATMANIFSVFIFSFLMALYQLDIRFENIRLENEVKLLGYKVKKLENQKD